MPETAGPQPRLPLAEDLPTGTGTVHPIVLYPDPVLKTRCAPAGELDICALRQLVADLFATLYSSGGRGLAAPQIGVTRRVFVMDAGWKAGVPTPLAMIEPEIAWKSTEVGEGEERCLSIPDHPVRVSRPTAIQIEFFDLDGTRRELALGGVEARIALHELDHLDGVLILDAEAASTNATSEGPSSLDMTS